MKRIADKQPKQLQLRKRAKVPKKRQKKRKKKRKKKRL
jgi:hypothetical protein